MSTEYTNPTQPTPLPPIEQVTLKKANKGVNILTVVISLLIIAAVAGGTGWFLGNSGGYSKAQSDFRTSPQSFIQSAGGFGGGFGAGGASPSGTPGANNQNAGGPRGGTSGKITAINGNTITLETTDSTITVNTDSNTTITKVDTGVATDLKVGDRITVSGQTNGNTLTAASIVLGNITGVFGPGGGPGTGASGGAPAATPGSGTNG